MLTKTARGNRLAKLYPFLQGNANVVDPGHLHFVAGADQFLPGGERDVQGKPLLRSPSARSALIDAPMAGIEHHGLDLLRALNSARTEDRLDDLADIHHRDQVIVAAAQERKVREETNTVDREFARPRLGADDPALASEGDGAVDAGVIGKVVELRDVGERHVRAIPLADDRPVARRHATELSKASTRAQRKNRFRCLFVLVRMLVLLVIAIFVPIKRGRAW